MSWNPRRFAALTKRVNAPTAFTLIWLSSDAIERMASAAEHNVLQLTQKPLPVDGFAIGLGNPVGVHNTLSATPVYTLLAEPVADVAEIPGLNKAGMVLPHIPGFRVTATDDRTMPCARFATDEYGYGPGEQPQDGTDTEPGAQPAGIYLSFAVLGGLIRIAWTLLNEPVEQDVTATTVVAERLSPGKGRRHRDTDVSIIDVRRPSGVRYAPSGREVEHDHRWSVRGHWRNQPFGPGRAQRRRIWIDSFVCGPEDKPLIHRPKVSVIR